MTFAGWLLGVVSGRSADDANAVADIERAVADTKIEEKTEEMRTASHEIANTTTELQAKTHQLKKQVNALAALAHEMQREGR